MSWQRELVGLSQIYMLDSTGLYQLTQNTTRDYYMGYWAANGQTCFVTRQYGNKGNLYLYDTNGSQLRDLSFKDKVHHGLRLSPDGGNLVFWAHPVADEGGLTILDWQNGTRSILTDVPRPIDISWAVDSQSLATIALAKDGIPLWIQLGINGQELKREPMTEFKERYELTLSPDWQRMAYVQLDEANESHLMVAKRDGSVARRLGILNDMESPPVWSPDSRHIVSVGYDGTDWFKLFLADASGSNIQQLMVLDDAEYSDDIYPGHPVWSSDSRYVAISSFIENPNGTIEDGTHAGAAVFMIDVHSGDVRQVSEASGVIFMLQWRPSEY